MSYLRKNSRDSFAFMLTMMRQAASFDHFAWHIGDAAVDTDCRRRKAGRAVSAIVDRDTADQHGLLWTTGGPFSPSLIEYRVSASTGTVSYSIRTPSWLTASSTFGAD